MKKVLSLVLVLTLVLGSFSFAFAVPNDVEGTDYESAVTRLMAVGVIDGYDDGTFKPEKTITRAEFAKLIIVSLGLEDAAKYGASNSNFTDVVGHWAAGYINMAAAEGIVNGMGDGTFSPDATVTFEQAVTMTVRALGYEPAITGGYPAGYLSQANKIDLTDDVDGTVGAPASRGIVAMLVDNAIDIPLMIQQGYGDEATYVISGEDDTDEQTLLVDRLDADKDDYTVTDIPRTEDDLEDNEVVLSDGDTYEVLDGFNFEGVYGAEIEAIIIDDVIVSYSLNDDVYFDAIEYDDAELTLIEEDKDFDDFDSDIIVYIDGDKQDAGVDAEEDPIADETTLSTHAFARVVVNGDDEVTFVEAFDWDAIIVVDEVDEYIVTGTDESADSDDFDLEDYTIIKDGETITLDDVEEDDILFINDDVEYAEVYNKTVTGDLDEDEIFTDAFELNDDEYTISGIYQDDAGDRDELTSDELDDMADADDNSITVYVDRNDNVILVIGEIEGDTDETIAGILTDDLVVYKDGNDYAVEIEMVNENGEEVNYEYELDDVDLFDGGDEVTDTDSIIDAIGDDDDDSEYLAVAKEIIEITIDEDGDVTEVYYGLDNEDLDADIDVEDDDYANDYRLGSSVIVFNTVDYTTDADDIVVSEYGDIEDYDTIEDAVVYYDSSDYVDYLIVTETDEEPETTETSIFVSEIKLLSSKDELKITGFANGDEDNFYTDEDEITVSEDVYDVISMSNTDVEDAPVYEVTEDDFGLELIVEIDDETGLIVAITEVNDDEDEDDKVYEGEITDVDTSDDTITIELDDDTEITFTLEDGYVYDGVDGVGDVTDEELRDLDEGDEVRVITEKDSTKFIKHVIRLEAAE